MLIMKLYVIILCVLFALSIRCEATKSLPGSAVIATKGAVWPRPLKVKVSEYEGNLAFSANKFYFMVRVIFFFLKKLR